MTNYNITTLQGKAAVFIRGFMEAFDTGVSLRDCQEAGKRAVEDLGDNISVPYISNLSRALDDENIIKKFKVGRKYFVKPGPGYQDFVEWWDAHEDFGLSLTQVIGVDVVQARHSLQEHIDANGGVLIRAENMLEKDVYKYLMTKFRSGELNIAYIRSGYDAGVKFEGKTHKLREWGGHSGNAGANA